jgi:hypothetical protein
LQDIFVYSGKFVGIGAWRPELKGAHGKFLVAEFEIIG